MRVPLARYPGMNKFVLDWLDGDERFLPRPRNAACRLEWRKRSRSAINSGASSPASS